MANQPRLAYETYIRTTPEKLWEALTSPSMTPSYRYGGAVESDWKPDSPIVFKAAGHTLLDGSIIAVDKPTKLVHTHRLTYGPETAQDQPSRVTWEIRPLGDACKLSLTHDDFDGETATYRDGVAVWPAIVSSLKTLLETGEALVIPMSALRKNKL